MRRRKGFSKRKKNSIKEEISETEQEISTEEIQDEQDKEINKYYNYYNYTTIFYDNSCKCIIYVFHTTIKTVKFILKVSGVYLLWICLHYVSSHLYIKLCVPNTLIGFVISPFMTATPHCQGLRWIVYNAANIINNMWVVLGAWICSTILIVNRDSSNDSR
jgi:hypothetical protein